MGRAANVLINSHTAELCFSHIAVNGKNMLQSTENITKYAQNILIASCLTIDLTWHTCKQQHERLHAGYRAKYPPPPTPLLCLAISFGLSKQLVRGKRVLLDTVKMDEDDRTWWSSYCTTTSTSSSAVATSLLLASSVLSEIIFHTCTSTVSTVNPITYIEFCLFVCLFVCLSLLIVVSQTGGIAFFCTRERLKRSRGSRKDLRRKLK